MGYSKRYNLLITLNRAQKSLLREVVQEFMRMLFDCQALLVARKGVAEGYNWYVWLLKMHQHTLRKIGCCKPSANGKKAKSRFHSIRLAQLFQLAILEKFP